jgi:hypothetical protein
VGRYGQVAVNRSSVTSTTGGPQRQASGKRKARHFCRSMAGEGLGGCQRQAGKGVSTASCMPCAPLPRCTSLIAVLLYPSNTYLPFALCRGTQAYYWQGQGKVRTGDKRSPAEGLHAQRRPAILRGGARWGPSTQPATHAGGHRRGAHKNTQPLIVPGRLESAGLCSF